MLQTNGRFTTLSRRWRLKKQTFARHLELRSGRPETANRVFGSYVRHHDRDWRTEAFFRCSAHAARADTRHSPGCARTPSPARAHRATHAAPIFTIRGVLIPY